MTTPDTGSGPDTSTAWIDQAISEVDEHTPATGHNVVAVDSYAHGDDPRLYLVAHSDDLVRAKAMAAAHEASSGDTTHVYSAREDATTAASQLGTGV